MYIGCCSSGGSEVVVNLTLWLMMHVKHNRLCSCVIWSTFTTNAAGNADKDYNEHGTTNNETYDLRRAKTARAVLLGSHGDIIVRIRIGAHVCAEVLVAFQVVDDCWCRHCRS